MGTLKQKLDHLTETKRLIKSAIIEKGVDITDQVPFREYPEKIQAISTGSQTSDPQDLYLNADMHRCLSVLQNSDKKKGNGKVLIMTYNDNAITFLVGGPDHFIVETCDGEVYESDNTEETKSVQHTWNGENCPESAEGGKLYWAILYTDAAQINQSLPAGCFIGIDTCILPYRFLETAAEGFVSKSINGGVLQIATDADSAVYQSTPFKLADAFEITYDMPKPVNNYITEYVHLKGLLMSYGNTLFSGNTNLRYVGEFKSEIPCRMNSMLARCTNLVQVRNVNVPFAINGSYLFDGCYALREVENINLPTVPEMVSAFSECYALQRVDGLNTQTVTSMYKMFYSCFSLETIGAMNTSNVTTMASMFEFCRCIKEIPLMNTEKVTTMERMFSNCHALRKIPAMDTSRVKTMRSMFAYCYALEQIPPINTSNVSDTYGMYEMFYECRCLKIAPLLDTSKVKRTDSMFGSCTSLESVPTFNLSKAVTLDYMFSDCKKLKHIPAFNLESATSLYDMFTGCTALESIEMYNIKASLDISVSTCFTAETLLTVLNNLSTVSGKVLKMGAANLAKLTTEQKAIATNKGWSLA